MNTLRRKQVMATFLTILQLVDSLTRSTQPVLWRPSKVPVTTGYQRIYLNVVMVSPCEILNNEAIHKDLLEIARYKCNELYSELFLDEVTKMCPVTFQHEEVLDRPRRSLEELKQGEVVIRPRRSLLLLLIGIIVATVVVPVGLGVSAVTVASVNSGKIADVKETINQQQNRTTILEEKVKVLELAVRNLRMDLNSIVTKLEKHGSDFDELKGKQIGTSYAISYVTSRLMIAKQMLQEATRKWNAGKIDPAFLQYINFTVPCGDDCPVNLATANKCSISEDRKTLHMDFNIPIINRTLQLVEADPFQLMFKDKNKTCTISYTGPRHVILSTLKDCAYAANVKEPVTHDLILAPTQGCMAHAEVSSQSKHFTLELCDPEFPNDQNNFIQIKPFHGSNYIYCPGNMLVIDGKLQGCPDGVFLLPITASFRINDLEYSGSQAYLEHHEIIDPLFTMRANWHIQPSLNLSDIRDHPLLNPQETTTALEINNPIVWSTLATLGFMVVVLIALLTFVCVRVKKVQPDAELEMEGESDRDE